MLTADSRTDLPNLKQIIEQLSEWETVFEMSGATELPQRLSRFVAWLGENDATAKIVRELTDSVAIERILNQSDWQNAPPCGSLEEVSAVALTLASRCGDDQGTFQLLHDHGIRSPYGDSSREEIPDEFLRRYIEPLLRYLEIRLLSESNSLAGVFIVEFDSRAALVRNAQYQEGSHRAAAFLDWMESNEDTNQIITPLRSQVDASTLLESASRSTPPPAESLAQIAGVGIQLMELCSESNLYDVALRFGISPSIGSSKLQDYADQVLQRYVEPAIEYVREQLPEPSVESLSEVGDDCPVEISESLSEFRRDFPDPSKVAFVMMKFQQTPAHEKIFEAIRQCLEAHEITALRADCKDYHDSLLPNVQTYAYGCGFGVAVFERITEDEFNPNVSLEVGYLMGLKKCVCYLKDKTLGRIQSDLAGKLYQEFDPQDPENTIPPRLTRWLKDRSLTAHY